MKAIVLTATLLVAGLSGLAVGAPAPDDSSSHLIDLAAVGGPVIYLKCDHGTSISNCANPTLWQESNDLGNLQVTGLHTPSKLYQPDSRLLI